MCLFSIEDVYNDVVYVDLFHWGHALLHAVCWSVSHWCRRQQERPPLSTSFLSKLVARWLQEPSALSWVRTLCFSSGKWNCSPNVPWSWAAAAMRCLQTTCGFLQNRLNKPTEGTSSQALLHYCPLIASYNFMIDFGAPEWSITDPEISSHSLSSLSSQKKMGCCLLGWCSTHPGSWTSSQRAGKAAWLWRKLVTLSQPGCRSRWALISLPEQTCQFSDFTGLTTSSYPDHPSPSHFGFLFFTTVYSW